MHDSLEAWADWLAAVGSSRETIRTRTSGIQALQHHAGLSDPRDIQAGHIRHWLAGCESAWTRSTYWATAHVWCDHLVATQVRIDNPMDTVGRPKQPKGVPRPAPTRVVRKVLTDPPGHRSYSYVVLAAYAGLRVHEIAKVQGEDIDLDSGWMFVVGKGNQQAWVPMHPKVAELAKGMPEFGYWFPGVHNGHVAPDSVSRVIRNAFKAVGSSATAHQLRHHFGTEVLRVTGNSRVAQQLLRHLSLQSTQVYTKVASGDLVEAINKLDWVA